MAETTTDTHTMDWLRLIRAEYLEIPGMSLTQLQVQRLWRATVWYVERGRLQIVCGFCHLPSETPLPDSRVSVEAGGDDRRHVR